VRRWPGPAPSPPLHFSLLHLYLASGSVPPELARAWVKPNPKAGAQAVQAPAAPDDCAW
jgi:hypothetical protein